MEESPIDKWSKWKTLGKGNINTKAIQNNEKKNGNHSVHRTYLLINRGQRSITTYSAMISKQPYMITHTGLNINQPQNIYVKNRALSTQHSALSSNHTSKWWTHHCRRNSTTARWILAVVLFASFISVFFFFCWLATYIRIGFSFTTLCSSSFYSVPQTENLFWTLNVIMCVSVYVGCNPIFSVCTLSRFIRSFRRCKR